MRRTSRVARERCCQRGVESSGICRIVDIVQTEDDVLWRLPEAKIHAQIFLISENDARGRGLGCGCTPHFNIAKVHLSESVELTASHGDSPFDDDAVEVARRWGVLPNKWDAIRAGERVFHESLLDMACCRLRHRHGLVELNDVQGFGRAQ